MYQIVFYKDEKGRSEVEEYIQELITKEHNIINVFYKKYKKNT